MKLVAVATILLFGLARAEHCYDGVSSYCSAHSDDSKLTYCSSQFSGAEHAMGSFEDLVRKHIVHSFNYLLMSTNFGNYINNREGMSKLYRKLSDRTWDDAIDTIKYMAKRGHAMSFEQLTPVEPKLKKSLFNNNYEMYELESLSQALDMSKVLANQVHDLHKQVNQRHVTYHDADALNFLEEKFVDKHAQTIRDLSGHTNDLVSLIKGSSDPSLALFMFDEHLKSIY